MTVEAEARPSSRPSRGRANNNEAEPRPRQLVRDRSKTEAAAAEAEPRPRQAKNCLKAASRKGSCLEDYISKKLKRWCQDSRMIVSRSSFGGVAIRYVLPVLRMACVRVSVPIIDHMKECRYRCSDIAAASVHVATTTRHVQANTPAVSYGCVVS